MSTKIKYDKFSLKYWRWLHLLRLVDIVHSNLNGFRPLNMINCPIKKVVVGYSIGWKKSKRSRESVGVVSSKQLIQFN